MSRSTPGSARARRSSPSSGNVHAGAVLLRRDLAGFDDLPLERVAYVHAAGGLTAPDGLYHDTHAHLLTEPVLDLHRGPPRARGGVQDPARGDARSRRTVPYTRT